MRPTNRDNLHCRKDWTTQHPIVQISKIRSRIGFLTKSLSKRVNDYSANMAATPTAFLVFYRFKAMSDQEAQKSSAEWNDLKKSLPSDVRLTGEYNHAWGTEYNGFLLFEADNTNSFLDWWSGFKDKIRWYVDQTHTIVARRRT